LVDLSYSFHPAPATLDYRTQSDDLQFFALNPAKASVILGSFQLATFRLSTEPWTAGEVLP
jgi:hypothetical protein